MYITKNIFVCLIFVRKGRQQKIFNNENFAIYGSFFFITKADKIMHMKKFGAKKDISSTEC